MPLGVFKRRLQQKLVKPFAQGGVQERRVAGGQGFAHGPGQAAGPVGLFAAAAAQGTGQVARGDGFARGQGS